MRWSIPLWCPQELESFARKIGRKVRQKMTVRIDPQFNNEFPPYCISSAAWDMAMPKASGAHRPMIWGPEPETVDFVLRLNVSSKRCPIWQKVVFMHELGHAVDGHKSGIEHQLEVGRAWQQIRENPTENAGSVPLHTRLIVFKNEWVAWDISENWLDGLPEDIANIFYEQKKTCLQGYADMLQVDPRRPR